MTLKQLKEIIEPLPPHAIVSLDGSGDLEDAETVYIEYKNNGLIHVILSNKE